MHLNILQHKDKHPLVVHDDNSNSLAYTVGVNSVQVYVNGILLDSSDYTATNGTAVVLSTGAHVSDMIKINAVQVTNVHYN